MKGWNQRVADRLSLGIMVLAVFFSLGSAMIASARNGWTTDEPNHLAWARRLLADRITERDSAPFFDSKSPITMLNVAAMEVASAAGLTEPWQRFCSRLPNIGWLAMMLAGCYILTSDLSDRRLAQLATAGVALDPNFIAHASVAAVDLPFAAVTTASLICCLRYARRPTWLSAVRMGGLFGLCFATKYTACLTVPLAMGLLPLAVSEGFWKDRLWMRSLAEALTAFLVCLFTISAAYLFCQVGTRLGDIPLHTGFLVRLAQKTPWVRLPFPKDFLTGIDLCLLQDRQTPWPVVVLGRESPSGVWYFFLVSLLVKTPLATLVAWGRGWYELCRRPIKKIPAVRYLLVYFLVVFVYFSVVFRTQRGYRFILMDVPLIYILGIFGASEILKKFRTECLLCLMLCVAMAENLPYLGNPLAFTNALVASKKYAYRFVTDSNVDWSQDCERVDAKFHQGHYGVGHINPYHILPGMNLIRLSMLTGNYTYESQSDRFQWVRAHLDPASDVEYTFARYEVSPDQFKRFLSEARSVPPMTNRPEMRFSSADIQWDLSRDPIFKGLQHVPTGQEGRLGIRTMRPCDIGVRIESGQALLCPAFPPDSRCESRSGYDHDEIWFHLEPGLYLFHYKTFKDTYFSWLSSTRSIIRDNHS